MSTRTLLLVAALAVGACRPGAGAHRGTTTPTGPTGPAAQPGDDLAGVEIPDGFRGDADGDDHRLDDAAPRVHDLDVIHLDVVGRDADGEPIIEASTPGPLLDQGNAAFKAGKLDEAEGWYRKLATEFPDSALAPVALYNIALVYERKGDVPAAIGAYREIAGAYPKAIEAIEGALRAAALLAERQRWTDAVAVLDVVLARDDLSRELRLEALSRKGYAQLEHGDLDAAEATFGEAIAVWRKAARIDDPYYIAMAHFYLGELDLRRFERAPLRSTDAELERDMAARRELVMKAYAHWREALEFKQAYWATAAGYQMSQVFYEYWRVAVTAPYPDGMDPDARPLYVREVHDRVRDNLEKALDGHRANAALAEAYGVSTTWSEASKVRASEILALLDREARGEIARP